MSAEATSPSPTVESSRRSCCSSALSVPFCSAPDDPSAEADESTRISPYSAFGDAKLALILDAGESYSKKAMIRHTVYYLNYAKGNELVDLVATLKIRPHAPMYSRPRVRLKTELSSLLREEYKHFGAWMDRYPNILFIEPPHDLRKLYDMDL